MKTGAAGHGDACFQAVAGEAEELAEFCREVLGLSLPGDEGGASRSRETDLAEILVGETLYGYSRIAGFLEGLDKGGGVLEIGAGSLLLSAFLAYKGFTVTALEPEGVGFDAHGEIRNRVLQWCGRRGVRFEWLKLGAEDLAHQSRYDLAYAINVLEHVTSPAKALRGAYSALKPGGRLLVNGPNYAFPYEPHFGVPLLPTPGMARVLFARRIENHPRNPASLWDSLNWITAGRVRRVCAELPDCVLSFNRRFMNQVLLRLTSDPCLMSRTPRVFRSAAKLLLRLGPAAALNMIPAGWFPMMEFVARRGQDHKNSPACNG